MSSVSTSTTGGPTRLDRRKARTRQALIDAAVRLIAEGRGERASIQEITEAADVGFGSFYNHFESKDQLFETASSEVLERWGRMIDRASAGIADPAEVFSISLRLSARLSWTHPEVARFITGAGLDLLELPGGLAPRALRDIEAGQAAGQFSVADAEVALSAVAGGLIGLLRLHQRHPERVEESSVDELAEACLRLLGLPAAKARRLAGLPLPPPSLGDAGPMSPPNGAPRTRAEMLEAGRALRARVPRRAHGRWTASPDRPDPLEILSRSNANRLPELVPVRNGRMMASPFAYYRGSPAVMAADLSRTPSTGIELQICGDAHLHNFGTFATPERNQVFDLNDFDETQPGPWEWDVKRLAASLVVAARTAGLSDGDGRAAVQGCAAEYRAEMAKMAQLSAFEVWHSRLDVESIIAAAPDKPARSRVEKTAAKARQRTSLKALSKLTTVRDGRRVIVEDPPVVVRLTDAQLEQAQGFVKAYLATLDPDRDLLLDRYEFVDAALKVVGVGSVGTRCFVVLLAGKADLDPLFLQVKEAQPSVLASYAGRSRYANQGKRVVVGQRIMQAASDVFLGWAALANSTPTSASCVT